MYYRKMRTVTLLWETEKLLNSSDQLVTVVHFEQPETNEPAHFLNQEQVDDAWDAMLELKERCGEKGVICTTQSVQTAIGKNNMSKMGFRDRVWTKHDRGFVERAVDDRRGQEGIRSGPMKLEDLLRDLERDAEEDEN